MMDDEMRAKFEKKIADRTSIEERVVAVFDAIEPGCKFPYPSVFERLTSLAAEGEGKRVADLRWTGLRRCVKISENLSERWERMHDADKEFMWRLFFSHYLSWIVKFHERTFSLQKVFFTEQLVDNDKQIGRLLGDVVKRLESRWF